MQRHSTYILIFFLFTSVIICNLLGCGSHDVEVNGEIFIVTKGRGNIRLGLVEVRAIPEKETIAFVEKKKAIAKAELDKIIPESARLKEEYELAQKTEENIKNTITTLDRDERKKYSAALKNTEIKKDELIAILEKQLYYFQGSFLFDGVPEGIAKAKTDADGKFTMKLKQNTKYALMARSERKTFKDTEKYYWFIWFTPDKNKTNKIILSNDNLLEVNSPESVFKDVVPFLVEKR